MSSEIAHPPHLPFRRGRYDALPEKPIRPHAWLEVPEKILSMRSEPFGAIDIAYRELGSGPPLLLIHGLMTSNYSWRYVAHALAEKYRVIAPDLPGSGHSGKPIARYSGTAYAKWIAEFAGALDIRGAATIANSLGGYLAMRAALDDRGLFSKLINLHSPGIAEPRLYALNIAMSIPGLRRGFAWFLRRDPLRFAHANVHYYHEELKSLEEARAYGEPLSTVDGSRAFANILGEVLAPKELTAFAKELEARKKRGDRFPVPLLLLYARTDPMVPPWIGPRLHALVPDAEFVWLEDSSHFAHVDTPQAVLDEATRFLGR